MGFQVLGRDRHGSDVKTSQNVSVCSICKSVVNQAPIVQPSNEDSNVVVRISAGVTASTGPKKDHTRHFTR